MPVEDQSSAQDLSPQIADARCDLRVILDDVQRKLNLALHVGASKIVSQALFDSSFHARVERHESHALQRLRDTVSQLLPLQRIALALKHKSGKVCPPQRRHCLSKALVDFNPSEVRDDSEALCWQVTRDFARPPSVVVVHLQLPRIHPFAERDDRETLISSIAGQVQLGSGARDNRILAVANHSVWVRVTRESREFPLQHCLRFRLEEALSLLEILFCFLEQRLNRCPFAITCRFSGVAFHQQTRAVLALEGRRVLVRRRGLGRSRKLAHHFNLQFACRVV
mmetsp:Transcript_4717/g.11309  ORF Transcript_4717/g.11309 Transcript_4717/m.11309 type:complete len:282 (+) Transcript_4717:503-1348(+)